jgi:hypothetical protein
VLNPLRNPNIQTVTFKKKNFQFLIEQTDSRLQNPSLHDYYCTFKKTIVFNTRYVSYDPDAHEFKHHYNQRSTINKKGNSIAIKGGFDLGMTSQLQRRLGMQQQTHPANVSLATTVSPSSKNKSNSNNLFTISFNK